MIHVPFRLLKAFHKVQIRLVRELEKKFSGKDVVIVANRRILPKPTTGSSIARPRSRTLTAVHAALLEDLVFPTEIVGKRTRYRTDGSKLLKVFLDPKDRCVEGAPGCALPTRVPGRPRQHTMLTALPHRNTTEYKLDSFSSVYAKARGQPSRRELLGSPCFLPPQLTRSTCRLAADGHPVQL